MKPDVEQGSSAEIVANTVDRDQEDARSGALDKVKALCREHGFTAQMLAGALAKDPKSAKKPIFVLGLGSQKCGTTWLRKMLHKNSNCDFGFIKEYQVWNYVYSDNPLPKVEKNENPQVILKRMMREDADLYISYFKGLISGEVRVTGDITPAYSSLAPEYLAQIRQRIEDAGFELKVVFLMRDPIDRLWSAARMEARNKVGQDPQKSIEYAETRVSQYLDHNSRMTRSDYRLTIENIEKTFPPEMVHVAIYEAMFEEKNIEKLEKFLGFALEGVDVNDRVNVSPPFPLAEDKIKSIYAKLRPQYEFCNERFPETVDLWRNFD